MPVYEYKCEKCLNFFEVFKPVREKDVAEKCPSCRSLETKRMLSQIGHIDFSKCSLTLHSSG